MRKMGRVLSSMIFGLLIVLSLSACKRNCDFSIAVIADPHCAGSQEKWDRMDSAIKWINDNRAGNKIELVVIVGDMAWGGSNLSTMKNKLDGLSMPYLPVIGDNEIHGGDEAQFESVFAPHFDDLSGIFGDSWDKAPVPVIDPLTNKNLYLQNYAFDYKGLHIICADWNTRTEEGLLEPEQAELYDFDGGTWPWFKDDVLNSAGTDKENMLVFSHHPMHVSPAYPLTKMDLGAFSYEDFKTITAFTLPIGDYIYASYGGHYHVPFYQNNSDGGYKVYAVRSLHQMKQLEDGTLLEEPTIKLINVTKEQSGFTFKNLLVFINQKGKTLILDDN